MYSWRISPTLGNLCEVLDERRTELYCNLSPSLRRSDHVVESEVMTMVKGL
jgi:hypothetical protein